MKEYRIYYLEDFTGDKVFIGGTYKTKEEALKEAYTLAKQYVEAEPYFDSYTNYDIVVNEVNSQVIIYWSNDKNNLSTEDIYYIEEI